ncbi:Rossmann-like domain-containing protein [Chloroflexota bacterium]
MQDVRQGVFQTAVVTRSCGLASTTRDLSLHHGDPAVKKAGRLSDFCASELVNLAYSESLQEASIGMATIIPCWMWTRRIVRKLMLGTFSWRRGRGRRWPLSGIFLLCPAFSGPPVELWVIEKQPQEGDEEEGEATSLISQADVVGITGTVFTNHTIENLSALCRPQSYVVILGGTTSLSPVLFDYGVDVISGTRVVDVDMVLRGVSQGATFRQLGGKRLLIMAR